MVGLDKPLARIWVSSLTCGSAKQAFCSMYGCEGLAWWGLFSLTLGQNVCLALPHVKLQTHIRAKDLSSPTMPSRQTFGPHLGLKFEMRERKTSVLPQCKVEGLAWWG